MRYALIIAGGSGTRLWPMSRRRRPKQIIPFIHGKSLLQIAIERLTGLLPREQVYVCAGEDHRAAILAGINGLDAERLIGEPMGRDTLNAVGLGAAVLGRGDPDAVIAVLTADHVIEPADRFRRIVERGFELAEAATNRLVTFGIAPTHPATGYGYLQLGAVIGEGEHGGTGGTGGAGGETARKAGGRVVDQFKEKPDAATAERYVDAGPERYLWNSGMFVWRASTLMQCIEQFAPENHAGLARIAEAWAGPRREAVLAEVYPTLDKISVDYAVMEPASRDERFEVAAMPMPLAWLDVGSWPTFAKTCETDEAGNALAAPRHLLLDCRNSLVASDDESHLIAAIGCEDLVIIHTADATLVCPADRAEQIKQLHGLLGEKFGTSLL